MIMLRKPIRRKARPTPVKTLQKRGIEMWKAIAFLRDGHECQVKKYYPQIAIAHTEILQIDHCFSRANKNLFFDISNSTVVCSACNMAKGYDMKAIDVAIHEIVRKREGDATYERMKEIAMSRSANINFSKRWWLEEQIEILKSVYDSLKNNKSSTNVWLGKENG